MTIFHSCAKPWIRMAAVVTALAAGFACAPTPAHGQANAASQEARARNIESIVVDIPMGEQPPIRLSLTALMELYK
ncbi:MAG TPA: hypothetical protein VH114_07035, partial [Candidatus Acidoferrum sp.]|nr:hypothetical protein [Candidatus Acidoferrum sp.]